MKTIKNYFLTFVVLTLFSCGSVLKITENDAKEEQRPILSEKEEMFYDGSDCGYFNNYLTCYNQVFSNGNFTGYSITLVNAKLCFVFFNC
jgi:hypothetical protein